jgi:hypothetical protein
MTENKRRQQLLCISIDQGRELPFHRFVVHQNTSAIYGAVKGTGPSLSNFSIVGMERKVA